MIRSEHVWYDVREILGSSKIIFGLLVVAAFFALYISFQFVYLFALIFGVMIGARGLIGRRCPRCDRALKEVDAERDKEDAFTLHVVWRCPKDGYEEKEKVRGDSGLFGVK